MNNIINLLQNLSDDSSWSNSIGNQAKTNSIVQTVMRIMSYDEYAGFSASYEQRLNIAPNIFYDMTPETTVAGKYRPKYTLFYRATNLTAIMFYWGRGDVGCWFTTKDNVLLHNDTAWLTPNGIHLPFLSHDKRYGLVGASSPGHHSAVKPSVIFIGSRTNYYHFIVDFLPYMILADQITELFGLPFLFQVQSTFQTQFLEILGITSQRQFFLKSNENSMVIADMDDVVLPTPLPFPVRLELVRNSFSACTMKPSHRKIFIGRRPVTGGVRRIINEDEVIALLQPLGFDVVYLENYSVKQQIDLFGSVTFIVAGHGAALTNMIFAPQTCVVIELMNDLCHKHTTGIYDCYKRMAHCLQLYLARSRLSGFQMSENRTILTAQRIDYFRLVCPALPDSVISSVSINVQEVSFLCDIDRLDRLLKTFCTDA